jgi:hypothetical protein
VSYAGLAGTLRRLAWSRRRHRLTQVPRERADGATDHDSDDWPSPAQLGAPAGPRVLLAFHIAEFGTWVAILLYAYERTGPASVGVVALVQLVPAALLAAPAAALGDRFPRQRVLVAGYLVQAVAMLLTGAAMLLDLPVVAVYGVAAVAASSLIVTRPTQSALLPALARTPDELTAANAAAGVVEGAGVLLGPLLAAAVLLEGDAAAVFLVAGGALVVAVGATIGLRTTPSSRLGAPEGAPSDPVDTSFLAGSRTVLRDADARLIVGLLTVRMVVIGGADVLFVLVALELLQTGESGAALLNAALGAGTIAGGALAFALVGRTDLARSTALGAVVWGIAAAALGLGAGPALAPAVIVVGGAGLTIMDVAGRTILQRTIRDEVLARVFGIQEGLAMAGLAFGAILVSALEVGIDLIPTILVTAAVLPTAALFAWTRLASLDRRADVPHAALDLLRRSPLFAPLAPPEREAVARRATWLTFPAGTEIIREGDSGDRYYLLAGGSVRVTEAGSHRRDIDVAGAGFGEIALLRDVPRTATVTAATETTLLAVDRASFLAALTGHLDALRAARAAASQALGR